MNKRARDAARKAIRQADAAARPVTHRTTSQHATTPEAVARMRDGERLMEVGRAQRRGVMRWR